MRSRPRSTERLFGVSARLLAGASVLCTTGIGLSIRLSWRQAGVSFGPDGTVDDVVMPFTERLAMAMLDLNYRQLGIQLLLASVLVGAAVLALHRSPSRAQVRVIRWEVLAAGLLALALVVALIVANLYVMAAFDDADAADYMGLQPLTELGIGNLTTLGASVLILAVAALWWLRLKPVADEDVDNSTEESGDDPEAAVEQEAAESLPPPARATPDSSDNLDRGAALGYPQDWSPEDFRRPS